MTQFKEIKLGQSDDLILNGNEYYIEFRLTPERHKRLRTALVKIQFGEEYDIAKMVQRAKLSYKDLNDSKVADATVKLYNMIKHAETYETTEDPALEACSLFILRKGEDVTKVDENLLKEKIADFKREPIARDTFLELALSIQNGLKGN